MRKIYLINLLCLIFSFGLNAQIWVNQNSGVTSSLNNVFFLTSSNGWAVGNNGTILKYNGSIWTKQESGTSQNLNDVFFLSPNFGWAVGDSGIILKYDGSCWKSFPSGVNNDFGKVYFITESKGWILEKKEMLDAKKLFVCDGTNITLENTSGIIGGIMDFSKGFLCTSYNNNYAGRIYKYNGSSWEQKVITPAWNEGFPIIEMFDDSYGIVKDVMNMPFVYNDSVWTNTDKLSMQIWIEKFFWFDKSRFYCNINNKIGFINMNTKSVSYIDSVGGCKAAEIKDMQFVDTCNGWAVGKNGIILKYSVQGISVSTNTLSLQSNANSTSTFNISSNIKWNASSNKSWLTLDKKSGTTDGIITISATENPTINARTATITITTTDSHSTIITVTQEGASATLSLSKASIDISSEENTETFNINSNVGWTISSDQSWLTFDKTSGSNNATITVIASANPGNSRTGTITVSGNGIQSKSITVTQNANNTSIKELIDSDINIYPVPVKNRLNISSMKTIDKKSQLFIYSNIGLLLIKSEIANGTSEVNMDNFSSGIYLVKIVIPGKGTYSRRIIKP
jgi:hypothetical protein